MKISRPFPKKAVPYIGLLALASAVVVGVFLLTQGDTVHSVDMRSWQFLLTIFALLAVNVGVLFALLTVLKWRRVVDGGMMAIVPSQLVESTALTQEAASSTSILIQGALGQISSQLKQNQEAVQILKRELKTKEDKIELLRNGAATAEKDKLTNKLAKVHSFLKKLEIELEANRMDADAAVKFLNDELEDLFSEFGLYELKVDSGTRLADLESDSYAVKSYEIAEIQDEHMTVGKVIERGYGAIRSNGTKRVVKPSIIVVKKVGE